MKHHKSLSIKQYVMVNLLLLILLSTGVIHAQEESVVAKLIKQLEAQAENTAKVDILNELSWEYRDSQPKKAEAYAKRAISLSDSLGYERGEITGLNRLGVVAIFKKDFAKADSIYNDVLKREIELGYQYGIGRAQNQFAEIRSGQAKFKEALNFSLQSLETFNRINDSTSMAIVSNKAGFIYTQLGEYDKALAHLLGSLDRLEKINSQEGVALVSCNLGVLYNNTKDYNQALEYLSASEKLFKTVKNNYELARVYNNTGLAHGGLNNFDLAISYFTKADSLYEKFDLRKVDATLYNNLGTMYHRKNDLEEALKYYVKGQSIRDSLGQDSQVDIKINMADIRYRQQNLRSAIDLYLPALVVAERTGQILVRLKVLNDLSLCYSELNDFKTALSYRNRFVMLSDSLSNSSKSANRILLEFKERQNNETLYWKDKEIATVVLERSIATNRYKDTLLYGTVIILLMAIVLFFLIIRSKKQRQQAILEEKTKEIEIQRVQELLNKQELRFNQARLDGQDKERKRIAKDLHDRLGSMLSVVKMHYKSVEEHVELLQKSNKEQYDKANSLLDDACEEVRKIANDMNSGVLAKFGLVAALEDLRDTLNQSKQVLIEFNAHGYNNSLTNEEEVAIYRVIQELINNVLKHANAEEVSIQIIESERRFTVMVEDDGVGFDSETENIQGMGLNNVASRVEKLRGDFQIDSSVGNGTTITVDIPIN